ncbi:MAG: GH92 family glycosyl hydrolase [Prevotellaceae bacterium]|nr:GH92 family glycosyl hydrolase [Prevotellaceae bacterium]
MKTNLTSFMLKLLALHVFLFNISCSERADKLDDLTQYVDPYIGTGGHGHVFLGANVPFGAVQLGPVNHSVGWDWCSGYHYSDSTIIGFSHTHLSGTGIGDLGDIAFMPVTGDVKLKQRTKGDFYTNTFLSLFRRDTERVQPGYYAVNLERYDIDVELTATKRIGMHKYTFPDAGDKRVIIDLVQGIGWDTPVEGYLLMENDTVISGYRFSKGWAKDQRIFFTAVFSKPIVKFALTPDSLISAGISLKSSRVIGVADFDFQNSEPLCIKVAISPVSIENAKLNMQAELPHWDFEKVFQNADKAWNEELNKIKVKTGNQKDLRKFYTAMYHSMVAPVEFQDVNMDYKGADGKVYKNADFKNYSIFSLWDTYRAAHPLMTIIHPEKMGDIVNSMLHIYLQQTKLPVWHLVANETDCMVGNPGIPVVADACLKEFTGFDKDLAFKAMRNSALLDERGLKYIKTFGYLPFDSVVESVAKGLEYALADATIALLAQKQGKMEDYELFLERALNYRNYFDKSTHFMRGKDSEGNWRTPLDPFDASHRTNDYTEGNAWQYTWLVPHDIEGLIELFGSEDSFTAKLDSLFIIEGDMGEHASPDVSGLIGQYAHGNEPSHHIIYLYNYVGQPWKTAEKVREVLSLMYTDEPAGLSGNEDVGQMSSWYILSSLGFYQVAPAGGIYVFGSPIFDEAVIHVGNGKLFIIKTENNSEVNKYIQSVELNGTIYNKSFIDFKDIKNGGILKFIMGGEPSDTWGVSLENRPYSQL